MTALVAASLIVLALLDGSFAGFRASVGRTGLIDNSRRSRHAAARGAALVCLFLAPVAIIAGLDVITSHSRRAGYTRAGKALLAVYTPYAVIVLLALLAYAILGWRQKYLAIAVILGPFTLLRPLIAILGLFFAIITHSGTEIDLLAAASVVAVLAVEPAAGRLWYSARTFAT